MNEYIEKLLLQIRCKKARPYIEDEIRSHLEDQIADNIGDGMDENEAERAAVADMGDPVDVGVSLDRIHKPQIAWSMIAIISVISLIGVIIHFFISLEIYASYDAAPIHPYTVATNREYFTGVWLGLIAMTIVYFVDYSVIAKYARVIGGTIIGIVLIGLVLGYDINGVKYIGYGGIRIRAAVPLTIYIPIYGAILYKYRNKKWKGLLSSLIWLLVPILVAVRSANIYMACVLWISMFVLLTIAIADGWFGVPKKRTIAGIWSIAVLSPIIGIGIMIFYKVFAAYQIARLQAFFHYGKDNGADYLMNIMHQQYADSILIGSNGQQILSLGNDFHSDYIFTYIVGTYGILAGVAVCAVMALLVVAIFTVSTKQSNRVGMVMGCGCGIVLLLSAGINILENIGYLPLSQTFLPFISSGNSNLILSYMLIGLVMSIYRYKNVYPRHINTDKRNKIKAC